MIMPRGQPLLLPAKAGFIWGSLVAALLCNMSLGMLFQGADPWQPDLLSVCIVFWSIHQPRRVGIATAFLFGIAMDIHHTALLGQHALAYTLLSFGSIMLHRRILWFPLGQQSLQVLPLFLIAHGVVLLIRGASLGQWPSLFLLIAPALEALLWPVATVLLLMPQRRAPDPDENRPL
ncbi:MAG: rod shape-determining protein MreD [Pseudomonadota bacterium]|jgi:rod shape-determining protein MreD